MAQSILEKRASRQPQGTDEESWDALRFQGSSERDYLAFIHHSSLALLTLSRHPAETTKFLAAKLVPITLTSEECHRLLLDLASADEETWRKAYRKLSLMDPRLVMGVEELAGLEQFRNYPARNRLFDLLLGHPVDAPHASPWHESREIRLEIEEDSRCFIMHWESSTGGSSMNAGPLDTRFTPEWGRIADGLILLETFDTPEANQLIERVATGHPEAIPTQVAREVLGNRQGK